MERQTLINLHLERLKLVLHLRNVSNLDDKQFSSFMQLLNNLSIASLESMSFDYIKNKGKIHLSLHNAQKARSAEVEVYVNQIKTLISIGDAKPQVEVAANFDTLKENVKELRSTFLLS